MADADAVEGRVVQSVAAMRSGSEGAAGREGDQSARRRALRGVAAVVMTRVGGPAGRGGTPADCARSGKEAARDEGTARGEDDE